MAAGLPDLTGIDPWPDDDEMAARCYCGHPLGQHAYGADPSPCDHGDCGCSRNRRGFDESHPALDARVIAQESSRMALLR